MFRKMGSKSNFAPVDIEYTVFFIHIKPSRALCHYNPVTGTNKQSYSNLNY